MRGESGLERVSILESELKEKTKESERIVEAIAKTGGLDILIQKAVSIEAQLTRIRGELEKQRGLVAMTDDDIVFDATFFNHALSHLYSVSDESRIVRGSLHLKIARVVNTIWAWGYDVAMVEFKDGRRLTVSLPVKRLPSRVKPDAKYHKPPKPKQEKHPQLDRLLAGTLEVPVPQRRNVHRTNSSKPYLLGERADEVTEPLPWLALDAG